MNLLLAYLARPTGFEPGGWADEDNKPNGDETKKRREGLESLVASRQIPSASIKDQFDTYYRILSRYYSPVA